MHGNFVPCENIILSIQKIINSYNRQAYFINYEGNYLFKITRNVYPLKDTNGHINFPRMINICQFGPVENHSRLQNLITNVKRNAFRQAQRDK